MLHVVCACLIKLWTTKTIAKYGESHRSETTFLSKVTDCFLSHALEVRGKELPERKICPNWVSNM